MKDDFVHVKYHNQNNLNIYLFYRMMIERRRDILGNSSINIFNNKESDFITGILQIRSSPCHSRITCTRKPSIFFSSSLFTKMKKSRKYSDFSNVCCNLIHNRWDLNKRRHNRRFCNNRNTKISNFIK